MKVLITIMDEKLGDVTIVIDKVNSIKKYSDFIVIRTDEQRFNFNLDKIIYINLQL